MKFSSGSLRSHSRCNGKAVESPLQRGGVTSHSDKTALAAGRTDYAAESGRQQGEGGDGIHASNAVSPGESHGLTWAWRGTENTLQVELT